MVTGHAETEPRTLDGQPDADGQLWVAQLLRARRRRRILEWTLRLLVAAADPGVLADRRAQEPDLHLLPDRGRRGRLARDHLGHHLLRHRPELRDSRPRLLLGVVVGVLAGLVIGRYALVASSVDWVVSALNSTPLLAVIPLIIVWFGLGIESKVVTVFSLDRVLGCLMNTATGVHEVEQNVLGRQPGLQSVREPGIPARSSCRAPSRTS